jgi:uncharacterized protein (TIGR00369 family)
VTIVEQTRSRTHSWDDPSVTAAAITTMSGLDLLQGIATGELPPPPIMSTLGYDGLAVGAGWARFSLTPGEHHYNPIGSVHGGVAATLLDSALGCAVHTTLPAGVGYTTVDLSVTFVRPLTATTGPVQCEGRVIHVGSRVGTAEARITDADGRLYAHATATCLIMRPEGAGS